MGRFVFRQHFRPKFFIDLPPSQNRLVIADTPAAAPELQVPSMALSDSEIYRHAVPQVVGRDVYDAAASRKSGEPVLLDGQALAVSQVYARSQRICEAIRAASLKTGAGFVATRAELRAAGARQAVHGPRDWRHVNEAGYRIIGGLVATHIEDRPTDACDDRWPEG